MEIRVRSNGLVMQENELRYYLQTNYDTLTPEVAELLGVDVVLEGPQPATERYQIAIRDGVHQSDGLWYTKYKLIDFDQDAIAAKDDEQSKNVREQRNKLLSESDFTQLLDSVVDKTAWASYRQSLRDLTTQEGFPWNLTWPTKP